ncbi:LamG domain-containing protein [Lysinibacillus fusiformis]|uniref:LamG domain-containing protein n=1 Tax=Lysinibacillus fusiformis TaxID=28031 RepID=UPI0021C02EFF|nr:LamG domain-containing protein [Lysinibacillus fusiformis]UXJ70196.1 LamG domain-containing protein [Lysinibacillus fusiformis]
MATTEQLMAQYGVAWFGFDEASGDVYDKLGNGYVGTVTGATRVEGWNGEEKALNFNGGVNFIQFNNPLITTSSFTIRFKIKVFAFPSTEVNKNGYLIFQNAPTTGWDNGLGIFLNKEGNYLRMSMIFSKVDSCVSDELLELNRWYDVIINYDSASKVSKIFINGNFTGIIGNTIHKLGTANAIIGRQYESNQRYFNGQLDDLQIYNKALSPSDFEQKRLVFKTKDNKNLVLSPTLTRVKEIPNTVEYMMLAQGAVVREIDSAVDRPPIDFTKPTTEYELVTNNRTPLGKGRMFTIPISGDFKTAMIEDNY